MGFCDRFKQLPTLDIPTSTELYSERNKENPLNDLPNDPPYHSNAHSGNRCRNSVSNSYRWRRTFNNCKKYSDGRVILSESINIEHEYQQRKLQRTLPTISRAELDR